MPALEAFHGLIVDQRRYVNAHLRHRQPPEPTDRYELWLQPRQGTERKFILNTREMPARRGHEVTLIVTIERVPKVLALVNWTTIDGVNYARKEPPSLLRLWDLLPVPALVTETAINVKPWCWKAIATVAMLYMLIAVIVRWINRVVLAAKVDKAIDGEAQRLNKRNCADQLSVR